MDPEGSIILSSLLLMGTLETYELSPEQMQKYNCLSNWKRCASSYKPQLKIQQYSREINVHIIVNIH